MAAVTLSADVDDLDMEPEEEEKPKRSSNLILWLLVAGLAFLLLPLFQISAAIKTDNASLTDQLASIQATLASTPHPQGNSQSLKDRYVALQNQVSALQSIQPTLAAAYIDWLGVMNTVASYDPSQIMLLGLAQPDTRLVLTGQASDENTVMTYAQVLRDSNQFKRVIVQSITSRTLPTAVPGLIKAPDGKPAVIELPADFTISLEVKTGIPATPTH